MSAVCLVVPCYNEGRRLDPEAFTEFLERAPAARLIFVNDGSTDATDAMLRALARRASAADPTGDRVGIVDLARNRGKAAAVFRGMAAALERECDYVGYWDADLATPLDAVPEFVRILDDDPEIQMVFGARIKLLGRTVERDRVRHYVGRIAATLISSALRLGIYDTQCGAKLFRVNCVTRQLFSEPFVSRWIFDVEILARLEQLHRAGEGEAPSRLIYELPLRVWRDQPGSKVGPWDFLQAGVDLLRIRSRYLRE